MIQVMKSKYKNGNGHYGLYFFKLFYVGFYFYPGGKEYTLMFKYTN